MTNNNPKYKGFQIKQKFVIEVEECPITNQFDSLVAAKQWIDYLKNKSEGKPTTIKEFCNYIT